MLLSTETSGWNGMTARLLKAIIIVYELNFEERPTPNFLRIWILNCLELLELYSKKAENRVKARYAISNYVFVPVKSISIFNFLTNMI